MFLIVFNLLECSNLNSVKWKHVSLDMQEFYKYKEDFPNTVGQTNNLIFSLHKLEFKFRGKQLERKQMSH